MKKLKALLPALFAVTLGLGIGYAWQQMQPAPTTAVSNQGKLEFTLRGDGGPVTLSGSAGQLRVIYLGYMSCPDVCPTALSRLGAALKLLPETEQAQIQPYFISVDGERDTPENLALYGRYFHPRIVGVTGDTAAVDAVVAHLQAYYRKIPLPNSALGYSIDHSANLYLLDGEGRLLETFPDTLGPEALATRLQSYL